MLNAMQALRMSRPDEHLFLRKVDSGKRSMGKDLNKNNRHDMMVHISVLRQFLVTQ